MSKGPVSGIAFAPVLLDLFLRKRKDLIISKHFLIGAALTLISTLPWHTAQTIRYGMEFWRDYIGFSVFERAFESLFLKPDHFFYLKRFIDDEGILALLFLAGLCFTLWNLFKKKGDGERFLLIWILCAFLPFQVSQTKIPHYMLSLYPALALMTSRFFSSLSARVVVSAAITALCAGIFFSHNAEDLLSPDYSRDQKEFAEFVKENSSESDAVIAFNYYDLALAHYAGRRLNLITDDDNMYAILTRTPILARSGCVELASIEKIVSSLPVGTKLFTLAENNLAGQVEQALENSGRFSSVKTLKGARLTLISGL